MSGSSGLESSRWASRSATQFTSDLYQRLLQPPPSSTRSNTPSSSHNQSTRHSRSPSPAKLTQFQKRYLDQFQNHQRFLKLLPRLKWKSATLLQSHHRAITNQTEIYINGQSYSVASQNNTANAADSNFKLDFFEFYVLLERVLVHLLGALGIVIHAEQFTSTPEVPGSSTATTTTVESLIGDSRVFHAQYGQHRFHANVLAALDSPSNALHSTLGTGLVRQYLGLAKEVRNKWKDVDDDINNNEIQAAGAGEDELASLKRRYHQILQDIQLDRMLASILDALEAAKVVAAREVVKAEVELNNSNKENGVKTAAMSGRDSAMVMSDEMMLDVDMMDFE